jgi:ribosome-associated protein
MKIRAQPIFEALLALLGWIKKSKMKLLHTIRNIMNPRIEKICSILDMNKAENIEVFELMGSDYFADYVVLASSLGERHTIALLDHLKRGLKPEEQFLYVDESGDWVAIDLGDILIHILTPQYRLKYDLESFLKDVAARKNKE